PRVAVCRVAAQAELTVPNCDESGPGSLLHAVSSAQSGDVIVFAVPLSSCPGNVITLTSGPIEITPFGLPFSLTITGPGADALAISGGGTSGVFIVNPLGTATVSGLTIENGAANFGGGAISNAGKV